MDVPPAIKASWDIILHNLNNDHDNLKNDKIIIFESDASMDATATNTLSKEKDFVSDKNYESSSSSSSRQRAIGVVYNLKHEKYGNYVPTILSKRYDALIFIDKTNALSFVHMNIIKNKDLPETFPTGV